MSNTHLDYKIFGLSNLIKADSFQCFMIFFGSLCLLSPPSLHFWIVLSHDEI